MKALGLRPQQTLLHQYAAVDVRKSYSETHLTNDHERCVRWHSYRQLKSADAVARFEYCMVEDLTVHLGSGDQRIGGYMVGLYWVVG